MTSSVVLLFGWGPEETGRVSALLHLIETASAMSLETRVFLFTDGSILAKAGTTEKIDPDIGRRFRHLLQDEYVKIYVCEEAAQKRAIDRDHLESGISMVGYATFLGMATEAKTVITV